MNRSAIFWECTLYTSWYSTDLKSSWHTHLECPVWYVMLSSIVSLFCRSTDSVLYCVSPIRTHHLLYGAKTETLSLTLKKKKISIDKKTKVINRTLALKHLYWNQLWALKRCFDVFCLFWCAFSNTFVSLFTLQVFLRCQYFSMSTYCLCFSVEGEEFDGWDKKYIICIELVGNTSLNWIKKAPNKHQNKHKYIKTPFQCPTFIWIQVFQCILSFFLINADFFLAPYS